VSVARYEVVHWFTTPKRLRELADEMEAFWKTCQPGQDKTVAIEWSRDTALHILVDQDNIRDASQGTASGGGK